MEITSMHNLPKDDAVFGFAFKQRVLPLPALSVRLIHVITIAQPSSEREGRGSFLNDELLYWFLLVF